jgi:hypothetical protein
MIIIGSISIVTHTTIGYIIGIILIIIGFGIFIKIVLMNIDNNQNENNNIIKYTTDPNVLKYEKYKLSNNNNNRKDLSITIQNE